MIVDRVTGAGRSARHRQIGQQQAVSTGRPDIGRGCHTGGPGRAARAGGLPLLRPPRPADRIAHR
ncbi:hypothetical protein HRW18_20520 [Streptomyces lunaelactis]|nr:hypothetical protein [Streptomyces lunaelactis]NUK60097.1 hypothetical protein [Streptomyces lunaelactis]